MQITAKLIQVQPIQTGQGKNGEWRKQDLIVETDGQYPKKICISLWGDKIIDANLQVGQIYRYDIDIESREFSGRWYTDIKAWRVENQSSVQSSNGPSGPPSPLPPLDLSDDDDVDGGLPF